MRNTTRKHVLTTLALAILVALSALIVNVAHETKENTYSVGSSLETQPPKIHVFNITLKLTAAVYVNGQEVAPPEDPFGPFMVQFLCNIFGCHRFAFESIEYYKVECTHGNYTVPLKPYIRIWANGTTIGFVYPASLETDTENNVFSYVATIPDYLINAEAIDVIYMGSNYRCTMVSVQFRQSVTITPGSEVVVSIFLPSEMPVENITSLLTRIESGVGVYSSQTTIHFCNEHTCGTLTHAALEIISGNEVRLPELRLDTANMTIVLPFIAVGNTTLIVENSGVEVLRVRVNSTEPAIAVVRVPLYVEDYRFEGMATG